MITNPTTAHIDATLSVSDVHVRNYPDAATFAVDAPKMAAAGWTPIAQAETSAGPNTAAAGLGMVIALVGILAYTPVVLLGLFLLIVAFVGRPKTLTVTYRFTAPR